MLIVISPAKKLNEFVDYKFEPTEPLFIKETKKLHSVLKNKKPAELKKLMALSDNLANLNFERYQSMKFPQPKGLTIPAALMFNGDTYTGLQFDKLNLSEQKYAQKKLRILSGLYGILKPFDQVQPYRLEMGTKLKTDKTKNLYEYWHKQITETINKDLKKEKYLINLASNEYFSAIDSNNLNGEVINIQFKEKRNGGYKIISFNAKKARGLMSYYIIKNQIESIEELKKFNLDDYKFNKELSTDTTLSFTR
jgi:cytoplasmic iron level regulating protein YaaA (DUF328/UPF0246 family)